ncbi:MFS transporter [Ktedonobacter sp. SOSP1-52]|uniref:MFS transporter n=1 Tax=Ktedonobacter sp. SOSP1-52 TaxID=2778366 RepID=UPI001916342F|nr:MFS transporter [Ktedonobacter sp. SOSP1-52]GHO63260.1 MFS transporter [Ktedonobacter sp. SOSP1-52]
MRTLSKEKTRSLQGPKTPVQLGLRANWQQLILLVIINAFVGGMVGLERSIVPLLGQRVFGLVSTTAVLSFIMSFGIVKALANLFAGRLSDRIGRKGVLVVGWLIGMPVPFLIIFAPCWEWVVLANVLLGINQGLCWSTTVIMKIDLVGPARRGLAMGLNEAAGYLAVSLAAIAAGYLAATYGLRPQPFLLGAAFALAGLVLSLLFVRESHGHARHEAALLAPSAGQTASAAPLATMVSTDRPKGPSFKDIFLLTSWKNRTLFGVSQAGLVNNLNDGLAWGLFPLFFAAGGLSIVQIGLLTGIYPAVWGFGQLVTGALSDRIGRKGMIVGGMILQGCAIGLLPLLHGLGWWATSMGLLGLGTALVYPTLLATITDVAHPDWRASAVGVYRLWRDSGYALGALLAGVLADLFGVSWAMVAIGALTALSGVVAQAVMAETLPRIQQQCMRSSENAKRKKDGVWAASTAVSNCICNDVRNCEQEAEHSAWFCCFSLCQRCR